MKKMFIAALVACAFLFVSCSSNVDKVLDMNKDLAEAIADLDFEKVAELEKEISEIMDDMTAEEKEELAKRLLGK